MALASGEVAVSDARVKGEKYYGTTLYLESSIELYTFFEGAPVSGMYAKATYTDYRGETVTVDAVLEANGNYTSVKVNTLAVADYEVLVNVTVYNADDSVYGTASDSVAGYVARNSNGADEALNILSKNLVKFAASALEYFL